MMNSIPFEILPLVLSKLDKTKDKHNARLVCKLWSNTIKLFEWKISLEYGNEEKLWLNGNLKTCCIRTYDNGTYLINDEFPQSIFYGPIHNQRIAPLDFKIELCAHVYKYETITRIHFLCIQKDEEFEYCLIIEKQSGFVRIPIVPHKKQIRFDQPGNAPIPKMNIRMDWNSITQGVLDQIDVDGITTVVRMYEDVGLKIEAYHKDLREVSYYLLERIDDDINQMNTTDFIDFTSLDCNFVAIYNKSCDNYGSLVGHTGVRIGTIQSKFDITTLFFKFDDKKFWFSSASKKNLGCSATVLFTVM